MASPARNPAVAADGRYEFLDGVRGLAALLVAVQHGLEILFDPHLVARLPVNLGETGVVLFFLVSGMVIPPSLARHGSLGRFWVKRLLRLYPAYWASLAGCLVLVALGLFPPPFVSMRSPVAGALANLTMLQSFLRVPSAIGAYWTLPLELFFYGLCSGLWVTRLLGRPMLCAAAGTGVLLAFEAIAAVRHGSVPAGRAGLVLAALFGAAVLAWLEGRTTWPRLALLGLGAASVVSVGLWLRFARFPVPHEVAAPPAGVVMLSWLVAALLFFAAVAARAQPLPAPMLWLGRISYSYYLWHIPMLMALATAFQGRGASAWWLLAAALLLTAAVAELCFRAVELPGIRLGRRFAGEPASRDLVTAAR